VVISHLNPPHSLFICHAKRADAGVLWSLGLVIRSYVFAFLARRNVL